MAKTKKTTKKAAKKTKNTVKTGEIERFREAAEQYLRADENVKMFTKRRDAYKPTVREYLENNTVDTDGKSRALIDNAVKWMLVPGSLRVRETEGVAALQAAIAKAKGDRKRILEACLRPTIDKDAWENAKAVGVIDEDLIEAYEQGRSYSIKWTHSDQISCPQCRTVVTHSAKFCSGCGHDLTSVPAHMR